MKPQGSLRFLHSKSSCLQRRCTFLNIQSGGPAVRWFSNSHPRLEIRSINDLPDAKPSKYSDCPNSNLELLRHNSHNLGPRNVLLVKKDGSIPVTKALTEFASYLTNQYPETNILLEPQTAEVVHQKLSFPVYTTTSDVSNKAYHAKTELMVTLGGDGTILHAASLFSTSPVVPPVLSFALGTLGFLGPWQWKDYRKAVSAVWSGQSRILRRKRLQIGVYDTEGKLLNGGKGVWAMNEVNIHRGMDPHLAIVEVYVDGRFLTEAVADGIIISTPTGSTAYSLSSFGSIVHPRVPALLLTPICPRSLSFRPLVLPAESNVVLRLSNKNRGREVEVSIDGQRWGGVGLGVQVRVSGELDKAIGSGLRGGIPCVWSGGNDLEEGWVGGLNGLLKFNYPFGAEDEDPVV